MSQAASALVRVSTVSQDEISQVKAIKKHAADNGLTIVKWYGLHGKSASKGEQRDALDEIIADMARGDYKLLVVTDSSRIDRDEDIDAQHFALWRIRQAGGDVYSIAEPTFGKTDNAGRFVTLAAQVMNAEKSKTVKKSTYLGICMIRDNKALHGALPAFWETRGVRYAKQAYCENPAAVTDIYERVANHESFESIGRVHDLYPQSIKNLVRFAANHTGVVECSYTYEGQTETWAHEVTPVVDSPLWWRANKVLEVNKTDARANKGGRPVAQPANWLSGVLDCPECGGKLYVNAGLTPQGNPRTPKLRCGGKAKKRLACGLFKGCDAQPVIDLIGSMFSADTAKVLAFQRVAGNEHELEALKAGLRKIQARLSATEDDDELDKLIAERKAVKARIESFVIVDDDYDYAPTGQTVAQMWNSGGDAVKRGIVRAVKEFWGMSLASHEGQWQIALGATGSGKRANADGIIDLGNGLCFRR